MERPRALGLLLRRLHKPIFNSPTDLQSATVSLLELASYVEDPKEINQLLTKFTRRVPSLASQCAALVPVSAADPLHGRRLTALCRMLPPFQPDATARDAVLASVRAALTATPCAWPTRDLQLPLARLTQWGLMDADLSSHTRRAAAARCEGAAADELVRLARIVSTLPGAPGADATLARVLDLLAAQMEDAVPASVGVLCAQLNRTRYTHATLALAVQEEVGRLAEHGDLYTAVQALVFLSHHDAAVVSPDSLQWLMEHIIGKPLDASTVERVLGALDSLPDSTRAALPELPTFVSYLCGQLVELLAVPAADGGLAEERGPAEAAQTLISRFLALQRGWRAAGAEEPEGYRAAVDACAAFVAARADEMVAGENPPFSLIPRLLESSDSPRAQEAAVAVLKECVAQRVHLPALQTFRFLLLMGDGNLRERSVYRYLRTQFAKTAADIPPVQLCAALQSLRQGLEVPADGTAAPTSLEAEVEAEMEREDAAAFFVFCAEKVRAYFSTGLTLRCAIALTESLYLLGCTDADLYHDVAQFMSTRLAKASPATHDAVAAERVCLALGEDVLDAYPELHSFLLAVEAQGERRAASLSPTDWMNLHDPANSIAPLTEAQQASWDIIERMVATPAHRTEELTALAQEYRRLLAHARPDDHKFFFGVCEEKVLKEDRLLKECLESLVDSGAVPRLSDTTIAAILHSLARLRFTYTRTVRRFIAAVSAEQWWEMEAAPLVQTLAAMGRLSLRGVPALETEAAARLATLVPFLSPYDTAEAVHALQSLGCRDEALLEKLMAHAAAAAGRFEEAAVTLLFAAPAVHRLLRSPEVAGPLLTAAARKVHSVPQREKISRLLTRTGLPRDLLEGAAQSLLPPDKQQQQQHLRLGR